jgi:DNA-binding transcriptional MerR regulator
MKTAGTLPEGVRRWLRIGEVSKQSGVGIEALRFYEKQGLLHHATRTQSGYRLYREDVLERLEFIKRAQVLGFSLAEIAHIIKEKESGINPCFEVREIVRSRLQELDERMKEMRRYRKELAAALQDWDEAKEKEGEVCGLIEGTRISQALPKRNLQSAISHHPHHHAQTESGAGPGARQKSRQRR